MEKNKKQQEQATQEKEAQQGNAQNQEQEDQTTNNNTQQEEETEAQNTEDMPVEDQENKESEEAQDQESTEEEKAEDQSQEEEAEEGITREEELENQVKELQEKYIRLQAEFDNYRKRTLKEKSELIKSAGEDVLKGILPVMDDFDRALETIQDASDLESVKEGMELIRSKLYEFLKQKGIQEIESQNQEFNTDVHEAISKIPAPEEELKGKVVDVIQKGYYLNDKILRYAKVVVGE